MGKEKINIKHKSSGIIHIGLILFIALGIGAIVLGSNFNKLDTDVRSQAAVEITQNVIFTSSNSANEDGSQFSSGTTEGWIGTGANASKSFLGLLFTGGNIPSGAILTSAKLELTPTKEQWINVGTIISGEKSSNPQAFSTTSRPSLRSLTTANKQYSDNIKWESGKAYTYDVTPVLQEVLASGSSINTVSMIVKGTGNAYSRKFISPGNSRLLITYKTLQTASPKPSQTPTTIIGIIGGILGGASPRPSLTPSPTPSSGHQMGGSGESMAMMAWRVGGKNAPNPQYDKCDDGTDVVAAHNQYFVIAYDGVKYPTWHPPVVTNPITGNGKCYFGHEHGTNPQTYRGWDEIVQHFGKDQNGDGVITKMTIATDGKITAGDRAGIPFGIANEHMDRYYNQEGRDSIFVRHEDHVGHKLEHVNMESDTAGNSTHTMAQLANTVGINIPFYKGSDSNTYYPTGVVCTHLHKFHQGTSSADAIRNNMHEVIFHSSCSSVAASGLNAPSVYPNNTVLLTGMMTFGNPGGYKRFCGNNRDLLVCPDGKNADGSCKVTDPLISKLPNAIYSNTLGRNMVDRSCLANVEQITGSQFFSPYEIWQGDLRITTPTGKMLAEHGRQWDVLDPIRFVDPNSPTGFSYNSLQCNPGGLLYKRTLNCGALESKNQPWDSPQSGFRGLKRTTYFGRNRVSNPGGAQIWWTDPLGGNAVTTSFSSGLKQKFSSVEADICKLSVCSTLNDRSIQRQFNDGGRTVHAPN